MTPGGAIPLSAVSPDSSVGFGELKRCSPPSRKIQSNISAPASTHAENLAVIAVAGLGTHTIEHLDLSAPSSNLDRSHLSLVVRIVRPLYCRRNSIKRN